MKPTGAFFSFKIAKPTKKCHNKKLLKSVTTVFI